MVVFLICLSLLKLVALLVDLVVIIRFDMGVCDNSNIAALSKNLIVHFSNALFRKVLRIKEKVVVHLIHTVLLSPLDVHPKHINWHFAGSKVLAAFNHDIR